MADELDEGLSHRLAERRVRCDDVGDREQGEQHPWHCHITAIHAHPHHQHPVTSVSMHTLVATIQATTTTQEQEQKEKKGNQCH